MLIIQQKQIKCLYFSQCSCKHIWGKICINRNSYRWSHCCNSIINDLTISSKTMRFLYFLRLEECGCLKILSEFWIIFLKTSSTLVNHLSILFCLLHYYFFVCARWNISFVKCKTKFLKTRQQGSNQLSPSNSPEYASTEIYFLISAH